MEPREIATDPMMATMASMAGQIASQLAERMGVDALVRRRPRDGQRLIAQDTVDHIAVAAVALARAIVRELTATADGPT
jgi:hypothetical protein